MRRVPPRAASISTASVAAYDGQIGQAAYSASKHAVVGLARTLANELGPRNIRVNTVHPGAVATPMVLNEATFRRLRPDLDHPTAEQHVGPAADRRRPAYQRALHAIVVDVQRHRRAVLRHAWRRRIVAKHLKRLLI